MPAHASPIPPPLPADEVARIRAKLGKSQRELAALLGYSTGHIVSQWEAGRKPCRGPAAQLLRVFDRSEGKAVLWSVFEAES